MGLWLSSENDRNVKSKDKDRNHKRRTNKIQIN